jgi:hypothetical protein
MIYRKAENEFIESLAKELDGRRFYTMVYPDIQDCIVFEFNPDGKLLGKWTNKNRKR